MKTEATEAGAVQTTGEWRIKARRELSGGSAARLRCLWGEWPG